MVTLRKGFFCVGGMVWCGAVQPEEARRSTASGSVTCFQLAAVARFQWELLATASCFLRTWNFLLQSILGKGGGVESRWCLVSAPRAEGL